MPNNLQLDRILQLAESLKAAREKATASPWSKTHLYSALRYFYKNAIVSPEDLGGDAETNNWAGHDDASFIAEAANNTMELCDAVRRMAEMIRVLDESLETVAAPMRSDGTYNRCREACELLAREARAKAKAILGSSE